MQYLQSLADKLNVTLIAIGIGRTDVKECFTNAEDVSRVDELASATFNKLLKQLKI
jgi:cobalamin biosynthesis protein CobT